MTAPELIAYINGEDIAARGLHVITLTGWYDGVRIGYATAAPYGAIGAVPGAGRADPRVVRMTVGLLDTTSRDTRVAELDDALTGLEGDVELRIGDADRAVTGRLNVTAGGAWGDDHRVWKHPELVAALEIVCHDPAKYDTTHRVLSLPAGVPVVVPGGTLATAGIITVFGGGSDPVITGRRMGDGVLGSMTFDVTLTASEALEIDTRAETITRITSGVRAAADDLLVDGWFFSIGPGDTLQLDVMSGAFAYRRVWK